MITVFALKKMMVLAVDMPCASTVIIYPTNMLIRLHYVQNDGYTTSVYSVWPVLIREFKGHIRIISQSIES